MKRLLKAEGLSFPDIAIVIANCDGAIEERKYSAADCEIIFARGVEKGRAEEANKQQAPPEFYDADGQPRWYEIAKFCRSNDAKLRDDWEREFIASVAARTAVRGPTEKQAKHLITIFVRLGGYFDPKTANVCW
jgi:hypothetical protein